MTNLKKSPPITDLSILSQAILWMKSGQGVALATVIETWGSAPRPVGSQMVIDENASFSGSISGGCVEGEVVTEALNAIRKKKDKLVNYEVSNNQAQAVGLACGGKLKILISWISDIRRTSLEELIDIVASFQPAWLEIRISDGLFKTVSNYDTNATVNPKIFFQSGFLSGTSSDPIFVRSFIPDPHLIIVGGVHIAQILASLGKEAGYEITLVDPRDTWANQDRFPGVNINCSWPSSAIKQLAPDRRTAIVTLSHDPKIDDPALIAALRSKAFYIGSLGSKRTHALRVKRLTKEGFKKREIDRIFAPVGLNISAKSPFEIAISIMAQIIQTNRAGNRH